MKLNFTYVVREPSDGQFGVVRGGQWNGLIRSWSDMWKNRKSKHLKGQLGPPLVTKNDHFLKLCHEGQLGPPLVTKNDQFLMLCQCVIKVSWINP